MAPSLSFGVILEISNRGTVRDDALIVLFAG